MKVQFSNVGRTKATWTAEIKTLTEAALIREIRKRRALMSNEIDVVPNIRDESSGIILVGGFRSVGEWAVVRETSETALAI